MNEYLYSFELTSKGVDTDNLKKFVKLRDSMDKKIINELKSKINAPINSEPHSPTSITGQTPSN